MRKSLLPVSAALLVSLSWFPAFADAGKVVIGDIDDMSGLYADINSPGAVEAIKMAIVDFGGSAFGQPIELLTADHQNKPDLGVQKFREWADRDDLTMVLGGANTGVSLAISAAVKEKRVPFFAIGAAGASLTGKDCTPYTVHYAYDTTALSNGTATTILNEGGKTWFFVTADYAFGTQLQDSAARVVAANGGKVIGAVRVPLSTPDFASYVLQAQSSGA
jgi:branched-chain amino acid transport system substrate-binding protein